MKPSSRNRFEFQFTKRPPRVRIDLGQELHASTRINRYDRAFGRGLDNEVLVLGRKETTVVSRNQNIDRSARSISAYQATPRRAADDAIPTIRRSRFVTDALIQIVAK